MNKDDPIVIERTANGWIVRNDWPRDGVLTLSEVHVFQHFDYDAHGVCSDKCLFGFLLSHFTR